MKKYIISYTGNETINDTYVARYTKWVHGIAVVMADGTEELIINGLDEAQCDKAFAELNAFLRSSNEDNLIDMRDVFKEVTA